MDDETFAERLCAVERALTDEDAEPSGPDTAKRLADLEAQVRELEATTQALDAGLSATAAASNGESMHAQESGETLTGPERHAHADGSDASHDINGPAFGARDTPEDAGLLDRLAAWL